MLMIFVAFILCWVRDGRLQEGDQILAINKKVLDSGLTHHEAIAILQQSKGDIELVVAKGVPGSLSRSSSVASSSLSRSSSAVSNASQTSVSVPVSVVYYNAIFMLPHNPFYHLISMHTYS